MKIHFLGAEQPNLVQVLLDNGADAMGLSYSALVRRAGGKPKTALSTRFPEEHDLLLDSGGYSANSKAGERSPDEWEQYASDYAEFVLANLERCTYVTEFDFLGLGPDWLEEMRRGVWKEVAAKDKFLPVWHPEQGMAALEVTAERFGRVAVVGDVLAAPGQTASSQLIRLARKGIEVHGLALTKTRIAENIPFTSVASSSWISPMKFGDVIVFDGRELHRYPKDYADRARTRHQMYVEHHGFDRAKWIAGDKAEAIRVGVWSWLEWADAITARRGGTVARPDNSEHSTTEGELATISHLPVGVTRPKSRELVNLPVFNLVETDVVPDDDEEQGAEQKREFLPVLSDTSLRTCNSCFLASSGCPMFEPDAACGYSFPVRVETKGQRKAVANGALAMQFQRVSLMYASEQLTGGQADPNLSQEIDRLIKMMSIIAEIEDTRDYFEMTVRAKGANQGVMSRLFGSEVGQSASRLQRPLSAIETDRILEGSFEPS